jgi:hypothetical protein
MLTLMQHNTHVPPPPFSSLTALLAEPFPQTPQDMLELEQRLATAAAQTADQILLVQLTRAHEDEHFVSQAIAQARGQRPVPLVHKGVHTTSVLLLGGTRIVLYMRRMTLHLF